MLKLNTLLVEAGIDPHTTIVARHRPFEPALRKVMPWIAAERPDLFKIYQQTHGLRLEGALTKATTLVAFLGHEAKKALFVQVYDIHGARRIDHREFWAMPGNQKLKAHGMIGLGTDDPPPLFFDLQEAPAIDDWSGKLVVTWPGLERSWWRWADRNTIPVLAITEESQLVAGIPSWEKMVLNWSDLSVLPASWRAALIQWRGVYYIYDTVVERGYVGSASGTDNILGRWANYAVTGHGGNKRLRSSVPANLRFSILQRTSPDMEAKEVIALEGLWKDRLHSREHGLNEN